ncbi:MAG: YkgJ family cysteine cluster protein [Tepidisphaeraceae bacterium]
MRSLRLPTIQNWACHSCGDCCRDLDVRATPAERERILKFDWAAPAGGKTEDSIRATPSSFIDKGKDFRLARRADGACVFLDSNRRCAIHARFGEKAKPLACRLYPFEFTPVGETQVSVSLHYGCPTAARGQGRPIAMQQGDLRSLQKELVERDRTIESEVLPPAVSPRERLTWAETLRITQALDDSLVDDGQTPLAMRLIRARFIVRLLEQANYAKVRGERIDDLLEVLRTASSAEVPATLDDVPLPDRTAWLELRSLVAHLSRKDTLAKSSQGIRYRLRMFSAGIRFAFGRGRTPVMNPRLPAVPFAAMEQPTGALAEEVEDVLTRYLRTKIQTLNFAGQGFYAMTLPEGFSYLSLAFAATLYVARWIARANDRPAPTTDDAASALSIVDAHFGRSPVLVQRHFRARVKSLESREQLDALLACLAR